MRKQRDVGARLDLDACTGDLEMSSDHDESIGERDDTLKSGGPEAGPRCAPLGAGV